MVTLGQGLRVADHLFQPGFIRAGQADQAVLDPHQLLANDV